MVKIYTRRPPVCVDSERRRSHRVASALVACLAHPHALHEEDEARSAAQRRQDQLPWQQQRVRIGTEEAPLGTEELYCNQLSWAY